MKRLYNTVLLFDAIHIWAVIDSKTLCDLVRCHPTFINTPLEYLPHRFGAWKTSTEDKNTGLTRWGPCFIEVDLGKNTSVCDA
jgi:hypothetical protein